LLTYSTTAGSLGTPLNPAILYGTCPTAAAAKVVTLSSIASGYVLVKGAVIGVTFTVANTATGTGNITLAVSGAAATTVQYKGAAITANDIAYLLPTNRLLYFQYDGTYWQLLENAPLGSTAVLSNAFASTNSNTTNKTYPIRINSSGQLGVDVPWTDTTYTIPTGVDQVADLGSTTARNSITGTTIGVTGVLNVAQGGIGTTQFATNQVLISAASTQGAVTTIAGTSNTAYVLTARGVNTAPSFQPLAISGSTGITATISTTGAVTVGVSGGYLGVTYGGIGTNAITAGRLLVGGAGGTAVVPISTGTANYYLQATGATGYTWATISTGGGSGAYLPLVGGTLASNSSPYGVLSLHRDGIATTSNAIATIYSNAQLIARHPLVSGISAGGIMLGASQNNSAGRWSCGGYIQAFFTSGTGNPSTPGYLMLNPGGGYVSISSDNGVGGGLSVRGAVTNIGSDINNIFGATTTISGTSVAINGTGINIISPGLLTVRGGWFDLAGNSALVLASTGNLSLMSTGTLSITSTGMLSMTANDGYLRLGVSTNTPYITLTRDGVTNTGAAMVASYKNDVVQWSSVNSNGTLTGYGVRFLLEPAANRIHVQKTTNGTAASPTWSGMSWNTAGYFQ